MTDSQPSPADDPPVWSARLVLGIPIIDGQHQNLLSHLEALVRALRSGHPVPALRRCLDFIEQYTQEHFQTEERYLAQRGYPGLAEHQELHRSFRLAMGKARRFVEVHPGSDQSVKLVRSLLIHWYVEHVLGADQGYAAHYRNQASAEPTA